MNRVLLLIVFLFASCLEADDASSFVELSVPSPASASEWGEAIQTLSHKASEKAFYFGTGIALGSVSILARLGWGVCLISPWASTTGNELLLLSHLCGSAAGHAFKQMLKESPSAFFKKAPPSQHSWHLNQALLSRVAAFSNEEKQLLLFLEKRWLAKATGFFSSVIDWVCPCFGISVQVHPETTSSYARSPSTGFSQTYKNRMETWKQSLPHPLHFPLVLTRPFDIQDYLPSYLEMPAVEKIEATVEKMALKLKTANSKVIVDLTPIFSDTTHDPEKWLETWNTYQFQFSQACKERNILPRQIVCIQRVQQENIRGLRLLPLATASEEETDLHHLYLVGWISNFGLSANRVELDRWPLPSNAPPGTESAPSVSVPFQSKVAFLSYLDSFEQNWKSGHPQKNLMLKGTLQLLKGLLSILSEEKWNEIASCPTRSSIAQFSFLKIKEQLKLLAQEKDDVLFFDTASHIELIHADLSSLLEISAPFTPDDFSRIYRDLLTSIPPNLQPLTSYGVHSSGMTSLTGIFKAAEKTLGKPPHVIYGENTYFECINAAKLVATASCIDEATENDWKEVDLILAQFNPALKRIELPITKYRVERISEIVRQALSARQGKPLTVALDCTFDFINSPRVAELLVEFQEELETGALNIVCYRSGLKFDLFGMDNYCGAPFYMIHNQDSKWAAFDALSNDPVLQADRLSLHWFCLAYQSAGPQLELYRKQIFDNTRALLDKLPARLLNDKSADYRVIPVEQDADVAFLDIKISGPFHQKRGAALAGGSLYMSCMEGGHPIFYRPSVGFYHPNFTMLFAEESTTIRLTLGLDPAQVDVLARCFERIDTLNGSSWQTLLDKLQGNTHIPSSSQSHVKEAQPSF